MRKQQILQHVTPGHDKLTAISTISNRHLHGSNMLHAILDTATKKPSEFEMAEVNLVFKYSSVNESKQHQEPVFASDSNKMWKHDYLETFQDAHGQSEAPDSIFIKPKYVPASCPFSRGLCFSYKLIPTLGRIYAAKVFHSALLSAMPHLGSTLDMMSVCCGELKPVKVVTIDTA